jgi:WD40 repeat protein/serine/threonine protein kinase
MTDSSELRNPVEILAEEFLARKRRGERPTLAEYAVRHPELADEIREIFPAFLMVEDLGDHAADRANVTGEWEDDVNVSLPGRLGDYRIIREIGRGGMGIVYEAEQQSLGRRVALKVLSAPALLDGKHLRRFEREAQAAARLHHTNIVPVFGVGNHDGHHYFVMQLIDGLGLDVIIRGEKEGDGGKGVRNLSRGQRPFSPGSGSVAKTVPGPFSSDPAPFFHIARIGAQVAEALDYAHREGILHRDIKPSNLLIDARGEAWVADFGLAKSADADPDDLTHSGDIVGTVRYMAPERFLGRCDARSDVYSLGLTLYEMVAQAPAYDAPDRHTLIDQVMHRDPPPLRRVAEAVPRDLETIITKAIARNPDERYATAGELAADLRRFETDQPIQARRISASEQLLRWCRRNKLITAAATATALALLAATTLSLLFARAQRRHAEAQIAANQRITQAHAEITQLATKLQAEGEVLETERNNLTRAFEQSNRNLSMLYLERGRAACEEGDIGPGLLWFIASARAARNAADPAWEEAARENLAMWRPALAPVLAVFSHHGPVLDVGFSPDGRTIATSTREYDWLWNAATSLPVTQPFVRLSRFQDGKLSAGNTIAFSILDPLVRPRIGTGWPFSPTGAVVVTPELDARLVHLRAADTGKIIGEPIAHDSGQAQIMTTAYRPDGSMIAAGFRDGTIQRYDPASARPIGKPMEHGGVVDRLAFSGDGKLILSAGMTARSGSVRLWNASTGTSIGKPEPHEPLVAFTFSPGGESLLTIGVNSARLWKTSIFEPLVPRSQMLFGYPMASSPDGRRALFRGLDFHWSLWDIAAGRPIGNALDRDQTGVILANAFSQDGRKLLTADQMAPRAQLWNTDTGEPIGTEILLTAKLVAAGFSPDGSVFVTGCADGSLSFRDANDGEPIGGVSKQNGRVSAMAFHPDAPALLAGFSDGTARFFNFETGAPFGPRFSHRGGVTAAAMSADGAQFVTGTADGMAYVWKTPVPDNAPNFESVYTGERVALGADARSILINDESRSVRLLDSATGNEIRRLRDPETPIEILASSPNGQTAVTTYHERFARLWNLATGEPIGSPLAHDASIMLVEFSPDGTVLLTKDRAGSVSLWAAESGSRIGAPLLEVGPAHRMKFSPDGKRLLAYDWARTTSAPSADPARPDGGTLWKLVGGRILDTRTQKPVGKPIADLGSNALATFSPDGSILVMAQGASAQRFRVETGEPIGEPLAHQGTVESVAFSPDGSLLLTGESFVPGRIPAAGSENIARAHFWNARTGLPTGAPLVDRDGFAAAIFSADGRTILTHSSDKTRARLWNTATRLPIGKPLDRQQPPWSAAFSPDGKLVATGCSDNRVRFWNSATGQPVGPPLVHEAAPTTLAFTPDGRRILSRSGQRIYVWSIRSLPEELSSLAHAVEAETGLELDPDGGTRNLDTRAWHDKRRNRNPR